MNNQNDTSEHFIQQRWIGKLFWIDNTALDKIRDSCADWKNTFSMVRFGHSLIPRLKLQNVVGWMMGLHWYHEEMISMPILLDAFWNNIGFPVFVVDVVTRGSKRWMECRLFHLYLPLYTPTLHTLLERQDVFWPSESRWHCVNLDVVSMKRSKNGFAH